ncbi:hypothetical protein ACO2Q0_02940 [Phenylobacterium sp. VNQ135]|uniref:hypothetical protein n=1 Tax=Phenylobacterium sp. VNQ135 TaxID=3400922 RepID=UPI003C00A7B8
MGGEKEPPLIADEGSTPFGSPVIDFAEMRIKFGRPPQGRIKTCEHKSLIYSTADRRVWCEDCERTVDSFDAFKTLVDHFHAMERAAAGKLRAAKEAVAAVVHRKAAKVFDRAWSGRQMAVCCPHCRRGLLPEDFDHGGSQVSAEIERARRARATPQGDTNGR